MEQQLESDAADVAQHDSFWKAELQQQREVAAQVSSRAGGWTRLGAYIRAESVGWSWWKHSGLLMYSVGLTELQMPIGFLEGEGNVPGGPYAPDGWRAALLVGKTHHELTHEA